MDLDHPMLTNNKSRDVKDNDISTETQSGHEINEHDGQQYAVIGCNASIRRFALGTLLQRLFYDSNYQIMQLERYICNAHPIKEMKIDW